MNDKSPTCKKYYSALVWELKDTEARYDLINSIDVFLRSSMR